LKNISIVQTVDKGVSRNFNNKDELVQLIKGIVPPLEYDTIMYVKCGCNREFIYATFDDIPADNLICECGQKVIIYS
jgi:hypothetical protein